jgi:aminoglycoside phosphotransferase (APT) family kinase protein
VSAKAAGGAGEAPARPPARDLKLVHAIVQRHFGTDPKRVSAMGGGLTNRVYRFRVSAGEHIVRTHADATKIADYMKEQWAMRAARKAGIPTPEVLEVGNFPDGRPYMIAQQVPGVAARDLPGRIGVLEQLGRMAAKLHGVRTRGFGSVFDWSSNRLSRHESWSDWLALGFDAEGRIATLVGERMLDRAQVVELRRLGRLAARWRKPPVLNHGDLRLKNVIVDPETDRIAAVIDWDGCSSAPAPYWDLSIALHDLGMDGKDAFLAGYGMKPAAFTAALPFLAFFNVLNYAGAVAGAAAKKDRKTLDALRLRLRTGLDLYV